MKRFLTTLAIQKQLNIKNVKHEGLFGSTRRHIHVKNNKFIIFHHQRTFSTNINNKEENKKKNENNKKVKNPVTRRIIYGLGNPGKTYDGTRHNIGFDIVDNIASNFLPVFSSNPVSLLSTLENIENNNNNNNDNNNTDNNNFEFLEYPIASSFILEKNVHFMKGISRGFNNKLVDHDLTDSISERRQMRTEKEGVKYPVVALTLVKPTTFMNRSGTSVMQLMADKKIQLKSNTKSMNFMDDMLIIYDDVELPFGTIRLLPKGGHGGHNGMKDIVNRLNGQNVPRLRIGIKQQGIDMSAKFVLSKFDYDEQKVLQDLKDFVAALIRVYIHRGFDAASHFNKMTVYDFQKHRKKRKQELLKSMKSEI